MNIREAAGALLRAFLMISYLSGLFLIFRDCLPYAAHRLRSGRRLGKGVKKESRLPRWAQAPARLASAALGKEIAPESVLGTLIFAFFAVFLLSCRSFKPFASLMYSLLLCALPFALLKLRLEDLRSRGSREGIALVTELNRQYRMQNRSIFRALETAASFEGDFPICRKQVYLLILRLRTASGSREIRKACEDFSYALGTVWGSMLATCVRVSAEKGSDVSEGLADIADQLKAANRRAEERKRLNSEAGRMTMYMVPILYIGTMASAVSYLEMSPAELARNQFLSPEGLMLFLLIILLFMFNTAILRLIERTRLDL